MRILVLGATGMLGHEAVRVLAERFEVQATARDVERARALGVSAALHELEASEAHALPELLTAAAPDVVLNCVGIVKQLEEASRPIPSINVNSLLPHRLEEACAAQGARLIHVSTDCVFSGRLAPPGLYTEDEVPDPVDLYGRSKLLGEVAGEGALTLRTSIIGWEPERASGLLEWLVSQAGRPIRGFANAIFSGLTTRALSRVVEEVILEAPRLSGLYHVSAEPITKLELVTLLDEALELGCEIEPAEEPHINRALDSSRFRRATRIEIPSWDCMVAELSEERQRA